MNATHFHAKNIENLGKNNSPVNITFVAKTSDIRNLSENIRSGNTDYNTSPAICCSNSVLPLGVWSRD